MDVLGIGRVESDLYWTVNGVRLRRQLGSQIDEVEPMKSRWPLDTVVAYLDQLSAPRSGEFSFGHAGLLVCGECGDLECGALTVAVDFENTTVTWSDFRWQQPSGWADGVPADPPITFTFDRDAYLQTIAALCEQIA